MTEEVIERIRRHAAEGYPEEVCGFLTGRMVDSENLILEAIRAENVREHDRRKRYLIGPDAFLRAHTDALRKGMDVVGIYHSHPDHPAVPSGTDLKDATFPGYTYAIVAVEDGVPADVTAWRLSEDRGRFIQEEIVMEGITESVQ